jgi:hypothetical protein
MEWLNMILGLDLNNDTRSLDIPGFACLVVWKYLYDYSVLCPHTIEKYHALLLEI